MTIVLGIIIGTIVAFFAGLLVYSAKKKKSNKELKDSSFPSEPSHPAASSLKRIGNLIRGTIKELTVVKSLSYEEAMRFFIDHKKDNMTIKKGAMLREDTDGSDVFFTQVFLDKDNNIVRDAGGKPLGRKLKVVQLDEELLKVFKRDDLVIVE